MKSLIDVFNETIIKPDWESKSKKAPQFKIKPSMIGSSCERKIYYASAGVEEDYGFDLKGKKRMLLGDSIETSLEKVFRKSGILIDYVNPDGTPHRKFGFADVTTQFPVECADIYIKNGYIDAVCILDGKLWIADYKSINLNGFGGLLSAKNDHLIQTVIYLYIFNLMLAEGKFSHIEKLQGFTKAEGVRILYVNKDDTEMKEFTLTDTDAFFAQIVNKIMATRKNYETKTLPPKTPEFCNTCNWRDKCKKNFNIS